jgi:acyl-CoA synthetase (AMP-forming)/AMP-acid ligase II
VAEGWRHLSVLYLVVDKLPEFKWLRGGVHFVDFIPKSLNGKINKRLLRSQYGNKTIDVILNAKASKMNKEPNN